MQQHAHYLFTVFIAAQILFCPHLTLHHGVDRLQMAGVGGHRQADGSAVIVAVVRYTQMVFDIATAIKIIGNRHMPLEFREQGAIGLAHHIGQDVQAAAVRHAHHHLINPLLAKATKGGVQPRNQRFPTIQAESDNTGEFFLPKLLQPFGLSQLLQQGFLLGGG